MSGDIVACEAVKGAVRRYLSDLEKQGTVEFPYTLNEVKASAACSFFPGVLRHSVGQKFKDQPFHLSPWQAFCTWNLYGWEREDGTRRFRSAFVTVARKNGKTTWAAGNQLLLATVDDEPCAQIFTGATKIEQAKVMHDEVERMVRRSPFLMQAGKVLKNNIVFYGSESFIRPLGSDKPFSGWNPHGIFFDELHEWREHHRPFFETMTTGSGARTQPLRFEITTAGDNKSQLYLEQYNYFRGVSIGEIQDESAFGFVCEIDKDDDPFDENVWVKANPNLGISTTVEHLRQEMTEAKASPSAKNKFIRYYCNRSISSVEHALTHKVWDAASGELSDWTTADCITAGVDLGGRNDLASFGLVARFPLGDDDQGKPVYRYEAKTVSFIAATTERDLHQQPWAVWIEDGKLFRSQYVIDSLKTELLKEIDNLRITAIAYDPYNAAQLGDELEQYGLKAVKMPQSHVHFHEPLAEFLQAIKEGRFKPDKSDPVLRWCALNMAISRNPRDQWMPDKKSSNEKIDAAVSMLMALRLAMLEPARCHGSLYLS